MQSAEVLQNPLSLLSSNVDRYISPLLNSNISSVTQVVPGGNKAEIGNKTDNDHMGSCNGSVFFFLSNQRLNRILSYHTYYLICASYPTVV